MYAKKKAKASEKAKTSASKDPWAVLGVAKSATRTEVKSRFRELVRQLHPDIQKESDSEDEMRIILEAAEALLKGTAKKPPLIPDGQPQRKDRTEKTKKQDVKAERVLFEWMGRMKRALWPVYQMTGKRIIVDWELDHYRVHLGVEKKKEIFFKDLRSVSDVKKVDHGGFDVTLKLDNGYHMVIQQVPPEAVTEIEQRVKKARGDWEVKRAKVLHRVVV
jgi:curved DNA-binding protein CbpA